jgi:hypothetical protein
VTALDLGSRVAESKAVHCRRQRVDRVTMTLTDFDPAAALLDEEEIAFFLADAQETGDAGHIARALEVVERARSAALTLPPSTDSVAPL